MPRLSERDTKRPPTHYLRDVDLAERYCVHRKSIRRWTKEGRLPTPVKLAPGTVRWDLRDVLSWEQEAKAAK